MENTFNKNDWILEWRSPKLSYYWQHNFVYMVYKNEYLKKYFGTQEKNICTICKDDFSFYIGKETEQEMEKYIKHFFDNDSKINAWKKDVETMEHIVSNLSWNVCKSMNCKEIIKKIEKLESLFHVSVALHYVTQPHITNYLIQQLSVDDYILTKITLLKKLPNVLKEQKEWILLLLNSPTIEFNKTYVNAHLKKWKFITAGDSQSPMTVTYLKERWEKDIKNVDQLEKDFKNKYLSDNSKYISKLTDNDKKLIDQIQDLSFYRFKTKEIWMKLWYLLEINLNKLSKNLGIQNIFKYSLEEIKRMEFTNVNRDSYIFFKKNDNYLLFYNSFEDNIHFDIENYEEIKSLNGKVGYPGKVTGKVVVIDWNDNIEEKIKYINSNTIIVVPQTTPNIVGCIQTCKGIVCDEGGITGHASIISRELKKTCIIDVSIGTKVFRDGDIITINTSEKKVYKEAT